VIRRIRYALVLMVAGALLTTHCAPAYSVDPVTLILLRIVRDKLISAGIERAAESAFAAAKPPPVAPPALPTLPPAIADTQLRRLIDEGFVHLTSQQRSEVYESVRVILLDPKHAWEAPAIIADLAIKASAVRQAHESLSTLSAERKRRIATEAGEEYGKMPPETREELASALRARMVPLPTDLTEMILAEFDRVREQPATLKP
jgi:hypothetical protein